MAMPGTYPRPTGTLSARERDVLALAADGLTNAEIAGRLGLSEHSVRNVEMFAKRRLGARTRRAAMALAFRTGQLA
jgi:DNA-binding CsgD family transcriptional regulator